MVTSYELSDFVHFGLKKRVEIGLQRKGIGTDTQISKSWTDRIFNKITEYPNQNRVTESGVRAEYNSRITQMADRLLREIEVVGGLENIKPETARMYNDIRREMGKVLKTESGFLKEQLIYARNLLKYSDKYGPTYKYLKKKTSHQEIAVKSVTTGGSMGAIKLEDNSKEESVKKLVKLLKAFKGQTSKENIPVITNREEKNLTPPEKEFPELKDQMHGTKSNSTIFKKSKDAKKKVVMAKRGIVVIMQKPRKPRIVSKKDKDNLGDD